METQEDSWRRVAELLSTQRFAVLSTQAPSGLHASLIAFWSADDLTYVVLPTLRATRKFDFLVTNPGVALLFDDRSNRPQDVTRATAVTATGTAQEVTGLGRSAAATVFLKKHPDLASFVARADCALVRVDVEALRVVTEFESVIELRPPPRS